jgi:hypothetical protein
MCPRPAVTKLYCERHWRQVNVAKREAQRARRHDHRRYYEAESYHYDQHSAIISSAGNPWVKLLERSTRATSRVAGDLMTWWVRA